jgi:hypothetical protein
MTKHRKIQERRLMQLESEFLSLLLLCLRECAQGRWGLFGQNDHVDPEGLYWGWPEAKRLRNLAEEIRSLRSEFGETNETCERFIQLCSLRGANVLGEPTLAADFLASLTNA